MRYLMEQDGFSFCTEFYTYDSVSADDLEFSRYVGVYEDYLPGRADEEELGPGYTVANYRQDHILADSIDQLLNQAMSEEDSSAREFLLDQAEELVQSRQRQKKKLRI